MLSLACFIWLKIYASASSDGIERSDTEGVEDGKVTPFVKGDTRQATVREKMTGNRGGKLCQAFMFYA